MIVLIRKGNILHRRIDGVSLHHLYLKDKTRCAKTNIKRISQIPSIADTMLKPGHELRCMVKHVLANLNDILKNAYKTLCLSQSVMRGGTGMITR